jgi:hypothetical protein
MTTASPGALPRGRRLTQEDVEMLDAALWRSSELVHHGILEGEPDGVLHGCECLWCRERGG